MKPYTRQLLENLTTNPKEFYYSNGGATSLLKCYFGGEDITTLIPLLSNENEYVQRCGVFVASEMGGEACILLPYVLNLLESDPSPDVMWDALDIVAVCSVGQNSSCFQIVLNCLGNHDKALAKRAMRLSSLATESQLLAVKEYFAKTTSTASEHILGLDMLLNGNKVDALRGLASDRLLLASYSAVYFSRANLPKERLKDMAQTCQHEHVVEFLKDD
ncbi:hypothetical protein AB1L30_04830 [Bremerella sp. JC817]|uniref:hypothetical protein n=1 Tax=Bremerella sp. JC817 TaxID=3231756 RepID=UPI0034591CC4